MKRTLAACFGFLVLATAATAQVPERLDRALTAIYGRTEYGIEGFGPVVWIDNGSRYVTTDEGGLTAHDTATGSMTPLATAAELKPAGAIAAASFSTDASQVLLFSNTRKVWRLNTRGDYWVLDLRTHRLRQVGRDAPPSSLMFAKFSPDGSRVAYVREQNLYVEDNANGRVTALTTGGARDIISGTSDWVNEEELFIRDAFKWSPDGRQIAYLQFDTSGVGRFTLINNTDALYPTLTEFPYPKVGTKNSAVRLGVVQTGGGATRWMNVPGDAREHYIPRFEWIDAVTLAFHHETRRQNSDELLLGNSRTGAVTTVYSETSKTWLDATIRWSWIPSARRSGLATPVASRGSATRTDGGTSTSCRATRVKRRWSRGSREMRSTSLRAIGRVTSCTSSRRRTIPRNATCTPPA